MFKVLILTVLLATLVSCQSVKVLEVKCDETTENLYKKIVLSLMQKDFTVVMNDANLGVLVMERNYTDFWTGKTLYKWEFLRKDDKIYAKAKSAFSGGEVYLDDNCNKTYDFYWDIRNELESLCKNKITFTDQK